MNNGIQFKRLVIKNFLSFGPNPTEIDLTGNHITVILGLNHDTGGDESRNGVGKSAIIDAISYSLYGTTVRGISNQKLVNKMARKGQGMLVILELDTTEGSYRIERGEAPTKFRFFRKDLTDTNDILLRNGKTFVYDITRNKSGTDPDIEALIGFDIKMFEFLIANTSESIPFMKLPEDKRRGIAERLMGLNLLTERAEELKEDRKDKKKELVAAESATEATQQANIRIERQISDLVFKESQWTTKRTGEISTIRARVDRLAAVDTAEQIEILELLDQLEAENQQIEAERKQATLELRQANRDLSDIQSTITVSAERFKELGRQKRKLDECQCPTCNQHWVPDPSVVTNIVVEIDRLSDLSESSTTMLDDAESAIKIVQTKIAEINARGTVLTETITEASGFDLVFNSIREASEAQTRIETDKSRIVELESSINPHTDTIMGLRNSAVKVIDLSEVQSLRTLIEHYNYLIDLLQSKDSFLRKAVIDRWLPKLNSRIAHYLQTLELPYMIRIENDLSMAIRDFGEEFDWGNLSKGQRQRVTIAINLAFQDLFEATNHPLSLLCIDELIDSGIDSRGASQALMALQETCDRKDKRVLLITHRADIADQVDDVMLVELKNRISRIERFEMEDTQEDNDE